MPFFKRVLRAHASRCAPYTRPSSHRKCTAGCRRAARRPQLRLSQSPLRPPHPPAPRYIFDHFREDLVDTFLFSNPSPLSKQLVEDFSPANYR